MIRPALPRASVPCERDYTFTPSRTRPVSPRALLRPSLASGGSPRRMSSYGASALGEGSSRSRSLPSKCESGSITLRAGGGKGAGFFSPQNGPFQLLETQRAEFEVAAAREDVLIKRRAARECEQMERLHQSPAYRHEHVRRVQDEKITILGSKAAADASAAELDRRATASMMAHNRAALSAEARQATSRRAYGRQVMEENRLMMEERRLTEIGARMAEKEAEMHVCGQFVSRFGSSMQ
jgi:hypothetical protein